MRTHARRRMPLSEATDDDRATLREDKAPITSSAPATLAPTYRSHRRLPVVGRGLRRPRAAHLNGSLTVTHDNEGNTAMATRIVTWFSSDKGYGFIAPEDGSADVFAHFSAIVGTGRRDLQENQRVEFDVEQGPKGLQATNIRGL